MSNQTVVFDTNIIVSALILPESRPRKALEAAFQFFAVVSSEETRQELINTLRKDRFLRYVSAQNREVFLAKVLRLMPSISHTVEVKVYRDPRDNKFLALAQAASAIAIVSGDDDLLSMRDWERIPIETASQFMTRVHFEESR